MVYLKALSDDGLLALPPLPPASKRSGAAKRKRARARHAMVANLAQVFQRIALEAAEGDRELYGHVIRLAQNMHDAFQPGKHDKNGFNGNGAGIIPPRFTRPGQGGGAPAPASPAEEEPPLRDREGRPYVEAE